MNTPTKPVATREQVDSLKQSWVKDPCWDIYDSNFDDADFAPYRQELIDFQAEQEALWKLQREARTRQAAEQMGLDVPTYEQHERLMRQAQRCRQSAVSTLTYYFEQALPSLHSDNRSEIEGIVMDIVGAAVAQAQAELLRQKQTA